MKSNSNTLESVSALIKELALSFKEEMKVSRAEAEKRNAEYDALMKASNEKYEKSRADADREMRELRASIKEVNSAIGGITNSNGFFAEQYFFNSFENKKQTFFGESFDAIQKNVKSVVVGINDEYDIMMINGAAAGIVEVKYRARLEDIPRIINKANTFRVNFPQYQNHRIYLALATMIFNDRIEDECKKAGIAIVKQVGETIIINDEHLKVF